MLYLWVKAFHIIFVVAWMAGMLIFPRYKIHQLSGEPGGELFNAMQSASAKLRKIVLTPAMLLTWVFGISMVVINPAIASGGWFGLKILLVLAITGLHGYFVGLGKKIDKADGSVSVKTLRMLNEVPFVLMIIIVILVVIKPF